MKITIHNLSEFTQSAEKILSNISVQTDTATVITLSGDLGAGKTTLTQAIARALGIDEVVTSPTFVIMKEYQVASIKQQANMDKFKKLIHVDAYRLEDGEELRALGWDEWITDPSNLIIIEWPEHVSDIIESIRQTEVAIKHTAGQQREIVITNIGE